MRYLPYAIVVVAFAVSLLASANVLLSTGLGVLVAIGLWDLAQTDHSLFRNYPLTGHLRFLAESIRAQVQQYFIESDTEGKPFDREQRTLIYARSKHQRDSVPFGTERNVNDTGYEWINHSIAPKNPAAQSSRVRIGNEQCTQPYESSFFNISAMSFGSLSAAAIRALNKGAALGGFAHDTGEGSISRYHNEHGGDLIWEIGTGYYGCRTNDGGFDETKFRERATATNVKMIEIKLSQGAKPGHGGILPAAKVSEEIAQTRGIPQGRECISPPYHREFDSPKGLLNFVARLRDASGGKPTGFKLCIGHRWEFVAICKAMLDTGIYPDFIVIDGKEGGTGAAPVEFSDHVGTPLRDGLLFAHNTLTGCNLKDQVRLGASGKIVSGYDMAMTLALGADWCNAARGFMFALGCLQSQHCHKNTCPVGIATQDARRQNALNVPDKADRVAEFHKQTLEAFAEIVGAVGLTDPLALRPHHFYHRSSSRESILLSDAYTFLEPGALLNGEVDGRWQKIWNRASAETFERQ